MAENSVSLATQLSRLVVEALVKIGLTEQDVLGGAFLQTDLPWQVPPLVIEAPLFGAPLSEYIDFPMYVHVDHMINLFSDTLQDLRNAPAKVITHEGYKAVGNVLPHVRAMHRGLYFSLPDGYPQRVSDYAGVTLALECANLLRINSRLTSFVSDEDNYYATLPSGIEVGVRDGLPTIGAEQWDLPVSGMVQELLRTPRGAVWEGCDYNIIAKVRDVAHRYKDSIKEFEAVDWALQALRVMDADKPLLRTVKGIKRVAFEREGRMVTLRDAVTVSLAQGMTDRQRIDALRNMLVPDIVKPAQFTKLIYNYYKVPPPVLAASSLVRIQQAVRGLLENEEMLYAKEPKGRRA